MEIITRKKNKRTFKKLRGLMISKSETIESFAHLTNLSASAISDRIRGIQPWKITECYKILDQLEIDHSQLHEVFPEDIYEEA